MSDKVLHSNNFEQLSEDECRRLIDLSRIPCHIAVIMDGNRRWAKKHGLAVLLGHRAGARATRRVIEACSELGVKVLTLYTFSTENWRRPTPEVRGLMHLIELNLRREKAELHQNRVKIQHVGSLEGLPKSLIEEMHDAIELTKNNDGMILNLAINYGGRSEILEAVKKAVKDATAGVLSADDLSEEVFASYLLTNSLPDPDLLIRTAGEQRISNFLLWQLAYTELYITPVYWPDFSKKDLYVAILDYQSRERRFGGVKHVEKTAPVD